MQNIEVALKLVDKFSAELKKMGEAVQGLEGSIQKQVKQMNSHFDHLQSSISKTAQSTQKHFQGMQNGMSAMSTNFVKNALAMGAGIFAIDKAAEALMSFDDARARVVGLAGLKGKDVQKLTDSALKIGGSTEFSATDVMSAYAVNARMIKDVDKLKEVTAVQTNLATLGQTTITDIAQDTSTLVNILGLSGEEMIKFGDSVAYMTTKNKETIKSNLEALTPSVALLKEFGNSFNDTLALVSVAPSVSGVAGSELGTQIRSMVTELNNTVRQAKKGNFENLNAIKQLGLSPDDLDLSKHKLIDVLDVIAQAQKRGAKVDTYTLFGAYGMILGGKLVEEIEKLKQAQVEAENVKGKLGEMSAPMRKTLGANLGNALGAVEALIVKMGDSGLTASIISVANAFEGFFNFLANNPAIVSTITFVGLLTLKLWAVGRIAVLLKSMFLALRVPLLIFRNAAVLAGGVLPALRIGLIALFTSIRVAMTANPLGALLTGLVLAYEALNLLYKLWKKFTSEADVPQAVQGGQSQAVQGGAFWETKDGQMTPYTPQSKQKITTDVNVIFENPPEGTKAVATQRGTSGIDVGTTNILKDLTKGLGF